MAHDRNGLRMRCAAPCLAAAFALFAAGAHAEDAYPEDAVAPGPVFTDAQRAQGPVILTPYGGAISGGPVYRLSPASLAARRISPARVMAAAALSAQPASQEELCVAGGFLKHARDAASPACTRVAPAPRIERATQDQSAQRATLALSEGA